MRESEDTKPYYEGDWDIIPYYNLQNELRTKVIQTDQLPSSVRYVAGADVAYNELERRVVAGIVVMDAQTLEVVDQALHEDDVNFPYIPGLFSFREVPPLVEAYKKLSIKPDLIVCDGHGIAHPKGVGMACHLGIELNVPTIGCAKSRLVGFFEPVDLQRGSFSPLIWDSQAVGIALRTQDAINPVFVSVGHKVSLETAREWVLRLTPQYRLPETTRAVDQLVNRVMKERTELNLYFPDEK
ncbi:deoxyribonuclease V [Spirosoma foliorum]|uniref:Endonuclease V n=2 Tax=Spirosoma foliorum TaxID=2710596 RepID=A0A7G5H7X0_9BACT|nr:deoxyribonuclease V [Spirosoma foliorum]